ncbi:sulfite exporter TauE/SafE family protein [bacterium]|jgi:hypothetical protein|nr:sulfite exporter TauE/SafE family protein [bacterium]
MLTDAGFLALSYAVAVIATIAGFGSSTLLIPAALMFMDAKTAVVLIACFHLFNNIFKVKFFWSRINFRIVILFGVPSIIFAFAGAMLISIAPAAALKKAIAVFLIIFALYSFLNPEFRFRQNRVTAIAGGSLSGLLAGLIGLGGAIRSAFLIAFNLPKEAYVATGAMIAFVIDLIRIPTYLFTKVVHDPSYYILLPFLLFSAYLGVKTGRILLEKINREPFKKIVLIALLLVGINLLT